MAVIINNPKKTDVIPKILEEMLPYTLTDEIRRVYPACGEIEEIRVRTNRRASLTTPRGNIQLNTVTDRQATDAILDKLCDGSLYAFSDTINRGYITLAGGIRVGVCGRAAVEDGKILGVYDISAFNIRIPRRTKPAGDAVCELIRELCGVSGVLIYSPPGVGKTTLLRGIAAKMAQGERALRVGVIDTRGELAIALTDPELCVDILSGYPREVGIEIASRTLASQLIVCDEIGDTREADAIISAQNCGVPFVASAHAASVPGLLRRTGIRKLHDAGIFGAYVGITRRAGSFEYEYDVTYRRKPMPYYRIAERRRFV